MQPQIAKPQPMQMMPRASLQSPVAAPISQPTSPAMRGIGATNALRSRIASLPRGLNTPDPSAVLAARQRLAAEQAGGVPLSIAAAQSAGRQDAAKTIERAQGRGLQSSYPSPLAGSAAQFQSMNPRTSAEMASADDWNRNRDNYSARLNRDEDGNGIPDRDDAVISKYGNLGINNVNELQKASREYKRYMTAYRQSGMQDQARPMSFDEFAKGAQERRKTLPVFGLDQATSSPAQPRERAQPNPMRVAQAQEQRRVRELAVMGMNQGMNPVQANQFALQTLSNERQAQFAANEAQAGRDLQLDQTAMNIEGQMLQTDAQLAARQLEQQERMAQFGLQMGQAQDRLALDRERFNREGKREDLGLAMQAPGMADVESAFRQSVDSYIQQGYPVEDRSLGNGQVEEGAVSRARRDAQAKYNQVRDYRANLEAADIPVAPIGDFPSQFSYQPPRIDPAIGQYTQAEPEKIVELIEAFKAERNRAPTPEEVQVMARSNNLVINKASLDRLYEAAQTELDRKVGFSVGDFIGGGAMPVDSGLSAYSDVYGPVRPGLGTLGVGIGSYLKANNPLFLPSALQDMKRRPRASGRTGIDTP